MTLNSIKDKFKGKFKFPRIFTKKAFVIFMLVLWFLGFIVPFIGLGFYQAMCWAVPVGWYSGEAIAKLYYGEYD